LILWIYYIKIVYSKLLNHKKYKIPIWKNTILIDSDMIKINRFFLGITTEFLGKVMTAYSIYKKVTD
jgi:hypothetical protein